MHAHVRAGVKIVVFRQNQRSGWKRRRIGLDLYLGGKGHCRRYKIKWAASSDGALRKESIEGVVSALGRWVWSMVMARA